MAFFYDRIETAGKITIRMKNSLVYYLIYYSLAVLCVISLALGSVYPALILEVSPILLLALVAFWLLSGVYGANSEINRAKRNGRISVTGEILSDSNPIVYEIPKRLLEEKNG